MSLFFAHTEDAVVVVDLPRTGDTDVYATPNNASITAVTNMWLYVTLGDGSVYYRGRWAGAAAASITLAYLETFPNLTAPDALSIRVSISRSILTANQRGVCTVRVVPVGTPRETQADDRKDSTKGVSDTVMFMWGSGAYGTSSSHAGIYDVLTDTAASAASADTNAGNAYTAAGNAQTAAGNAQTAADDAAAKALLAKTAAEDASTGIGVTSGTSLVARIGLVTGANGGTVSAVVDNLAAAVGATSGTSIVARIANLQSDVGDATSGGTSLYDMLVNLDTEVDDIHTDTAAITTDVLKVLNLSPTSALATALSGVGSISGLLADIKAETDQIGSPVGTETLASLLEAVQDAIGAYTTNSVESDLTSVKDSLFSILHLNSPSVLRYYLQGTDADSALTKLLARLGTPAVGHTVSGDLGSSALDTDTLASLLHQLASFIGDYTVGTSVHGDLADVLSGYSTLKSDAGNAASRATDILTRVGTQVSAETVLSQLDVALTRLNHVLDLDTASALQLYLQGVHGDSALTELLNRLGMPTSGHTIAGDIGTPGTPGSDTLVSFLQRLATLLGAYTGTGSGTEADTVKGNLSKVLTVDFTTLARDASNAASNTADLPAVLPSISTNTGKLPGIEAAIGTIANTTEATQGDVRMLVELGAGRAVYSDDRTQLAIHSVETDTLVATVPLTYVPSGPYKGRLKTRGRIVSEGTHDTWQFTFGGTISGPGSAVLTLGGTGYLGVTLNLPTLDTLATAVQQSAAVGEAPVRLVTCSGISDATAAIKFDGATVASYVASGAKTDAEVATGLALAFSHTGWTAARLDTQVVLVGPVGVTSTIACTAGVSPAYNWPVEAFANGKAANTDYTVTVAGHVVTVERVSTGHNSDIPTMTADGVGVTVSASHTVVGA